MLRDLQILTHSCRKHTGEKPFICICGRMFSRMDNLRQHAQTIHRSVDTMVDLRTVPYGNDSMYSHPRQEYGAPHSLPTQGSHGMMSLTGSASNGSLQGILGGYSWPGPEGQRRMAPPNASSTLSQKVWQQLSNGPNGPISPENSVRGNFQKHTESFGAMLSSDYAGQHPTFPAQGLSSNYYNPSKPVAPHSEFSRFETASSAQQGRGEAQQQWWNPPPARQVSPGTWTAGSTSSTMEMPYQPRQEWSNPVEQSPNRSTFGLHPDYALASLPRSGAYAHGSRGAGEAVALPSPSSLPPSLGSAPSSLSERRSSNHSLDSDNSADGRRVSIAELCTEKERFHRS